MPDRSRSRPRDVNEIARQIVDEVAGEREPFDPEARLAASDRAVYNEEARSTWWRQRGLNPHRPLLKGTPEGLSFTPVFTEHVKRCLLHGGHLFLVRQEARDFRLTHYRLCYDHPWLGLVRPKPGGRSLNERQTSFWEASCLVPAFRSLARWAIVSCALLTFRSRCAPPQSAASPAKRKGLWSWRGSWSFLLIPATLAAGSPPDTVSEYADGTRDCPGCAAEGRDPNRVRGDAQLCYRCERVVHNDVMAGIAEMQPWLRRQLAFTDYLIEHKLDAA